jgi:hypothetical protein
MSGDEHFVRFEPWLAVSICIFMSTGFVLFLYVWFLFGYKKVRRDSNTGMKQRMISTTIFSVISIFVVNIGTEESILSLNFWCALGVTFFGPSEKMFFFRGRMA